MHRVNKLICTSTQCLQILKRKYHVTLIGGATEIGQTLGLLLRAQPSITKLTIHDIQEQTPGVVLDLSHVPAEGKLEGFCGEDCLDRALQSCHVVIAAGGTIRKPGMTKLNFFKANTEFMKNLATKVAKLSPPPFFGIVTEPINSIVPMTAEILRSNGQYIPKKLFGITSVDVLTAQALYAADTGFHAKDCHVPIIGGHSKQTMVPLMSQSKPLCEMDDKYRQEFSEKLRNASDVVTIAKQGWSPTLSVAYGALIFVRSILDALDGRPGRVNAYVENNDFGTGFFSGPVNIDQYGVVDMHRYTDLSRYECYLLERSIKQLRKDIVNGRKILELPDQTIS